MTEAELKNFLIALPNYPDVTISKKSPTGSGMLKWCVDIEFYRGNSLYQLGHMVTCMIADTNRMQAL